MVLSTGTRVIEQLTAAHAVLTRLQYEALQRSPYAQMSKSEADAYDNRLARIIEIHRQLANHRAEAVVEGTNVPCCPSIEDKPAML
jgi:hypothetical protein